MVLSCSLIGIARREAAAEHLFRYLLRGLCSLGRPRLKRKLGRLVALLIVAGYLLFAHGCHGDEDNELFNAVRTVSIR